jgi:hypothetical protein
LRDVLLAQVLGLLAQTLDALAGLAELLRLLLLLLPRRLGFRALRSGRVARGIRARLGTGFGRAATDEGGHEEARNEQGSGAHELWGLPCASSAHRARTQSDA